MFFLKHEYDSVNPLFKTLYWFFITFRIKPNTLRWPKRPSVARPFFSSGLSPIPFTQPVLCLDTLTLPWTDLRTFACSPVFHWNSSSFTPWFPHDSLSHFVHLSAQVLKYSLFHHLGPLLLPLLCTHAQSLPSWDAFLFHFTYYL